MQAVTNQNFGLLIAYVLPGFTILWGLAAHSTLIDGWISASPATEPTIGGFLYVTVASVGLGLTVSTIRWLVIDRLHHHTGIPAPDFAFGKMSQHATALEMLVQAHYRYYQWYANMVVAIPIAVALRLAGQQVSVALILAGVFCCVVFLMGSRDSLRKYYGRVEAVLSS